MSKYSEVIHLKKVWWSWGLKNPVDFLQFNTWATPQASQPWLIQWNAVDGTYDMGLLNSSVLQVGQETMFYGKAQGDISNGDNVQFAGVQGDHILIKKAVGSEIDANPHFFLWVATENIANNAYWYVTSFGKVNGIYTNTPNNNDTQNWVAGDILYLNTTTGYLTKTIPTVPHRIIRVAAVIKEQTGASESGIIIVRPTFGIKLEDLDDINGTALTTDGQIPTWHNTEKYFDFDKNINDYLKLDQTTQQTIVNGIPLLEPTRVINQDNELVDKKYVDDNYTNNTFETVSRNLRAYPYVLNYTWSLLTTIVYTLPTWIITKTFNYTSWYISSIVLSGDVPSGIKLTKTITYSAGILTSVTYS